MKSLMGYLNRHETASKPAVLLLTLVSIVLVLAIGFADYRLTGAVDLSIFYLLPVMLVTLTAGKRSGYGMAAVSALTALWANLAAPEHLIRPLILYWDSGVVLGFYLLVVTILGAWDKERMYARKDFLTGIANRQAFFETVEREIERSRRYQRPLTIGFLDCDNFKQINDTLGHRTGDQVLKALAEVLQKTLRKTDLVARLGGDEFAILLPETGAEPVQVIFERVQKAVGELRQKNEWLLTVSIGVATFLRPPGSVEELIEKADSLMYSIKEDQRKSKIEQRIFSD